MHACVWQIQINSSENEHVGLARKGLIKFNIILDLILNIFGNFHGK